MAMGRRGFKGRVELEVCEIIGSTWSAYGVLSCEELNQTLGQWHEA